MFDFEHSFIKILKLRFKKFFYKSVKVINDKGEFLMLKKQIISIMKSNKLLILQS